MPIDFERLAGHPRLLVTAFLNPVQGTRFQPTGFPDLGHAAYEDPAGSGQVGTDRKCPEHGQSP